MEYSNQYPYFQQDVYSSLQQGIPTEMFNISVLANTIHLNPQNIDDLVDMEIERIKGNWLYSEEQHVEQMLRENPITIERRPNNNQYGQRESEDEELDVVTVTSPTKKATNTLLQQQRAEACRRSRYNNKIKKAKSRYRHSFMSQKLLQSTQLFNCIQDAILQAENNVLKEGFTVDYLQHLRKNFGVKSKVLNLPYIAPLPFSSACHSKHEVDA